jgi:CrcB protein
MRTVVNKSLAVVPARSSVVRFRWPLVSLPMAPEPPEDLPVDPDVLAPARRPPRPRRWDIMLAISVGGALGGSMRHAVSLAVPDGSGGFPWGTFLENVSGSLFLAALVVFLIEVWPPSRYLRPFLGVGVLGGFTTFSTFTNETRELLVAGEALVAFGYVGATLAVGLLATWTGLRVARRAAGLGRVR